MSGTNDMECLLLILFNHKELKFLLLYKLT